MRAKVRLRVALFKLSRYMSNALTSMSKLLSLMTQSPGLSPLLSSRACRLTTSFSTSLESTSTGKEYKQQCHGVCFQCSEQNMLHTLSVL